MRNSEPPLVTVGIPVFNGENGLARALDSILQQRHKNLEVIISDNGSTDATQKISLAYASKFSQIRYFRSETNNGAIWNFNRVFELSSGKYFMWAAHDDHRDSEFVSKCVAKLEDREDAVLCQVGTAIFIEDHEAPMCIVAPSELSGGIRGLVGRYERTLRHCPATAIYGLFRAQAMRRTRLFEPIIATDRAFIPELSIYGEIIFTPDVLLSYYGRKTWNTVDEDYRSYFGDTRKTKPWWYLPFLILFVNHWKRIASADVSSISKCRLWLVITKNELRQAVVKVIFKIARLLCPTKLKQKLGEMMYWRFLYEPYLKVVEKDLFVERQIKPCLGWWR